jgi:hypothetical protein
MPAGHRSKLSGCRDTQVRMKGACAQRQEFIIIGYSDPRTGERALGALYLGHRANGLSVKSTSHAKSSLRSLETALALVIDDDGFHIQDCKCCLDLFDGGNERRELSRPVLAIARTSQ